MVKSRWIFENNLTMNLSHLQIMMPTFFQNVPETGRRDKSLEFGEKHPRIHRYIATFQRLPSLKLTFCTRKWMVRIRSFPFWGPAHFQVRTVSFRECKQKQLAWHFGAVLGPELVEFSSHEMPSLHV